MIKTLLHHTSPRLTHTASDSTGGDGPDERLDGDGPRVVPGADDQHHSQRLRFDVDGVGKGQQVLLHGPRRRPLLQLPDGQADLLLQAQSLEELRHHLALHANTTSCHSSMILLLLMSHTGCFLLLRNRGNLQESLGDSIAHWFYPARKWRNCGGTNGRRGSKTTMQRCTENILLERNRQKTLNILLFPVLCWDFMLWNESVVILSCLNYLLYELFSTNKCALP